MGKIADRALEIAEEKFIASSGPGGQNVNKVATSVQLRVDVFQIGLPPEAFERLKDIAGSKLTKNGEIVFTANEYRTQEQNREAAREAALIAEHHHKAADHHRDRAQRDEYVDDPFHRPDEEIAHLQILRG